MDIPKILYIYIYIYILSFHSFLPLILPKQVVTEQALLLFFMEKKFRRKQIDREWNEHSLTTITFLLLNFKRNI